MDRQVLAEILNKTQACSSVDDLRSLFEKNGIWLNDAAAQSAYHAVESARSKAGALSDEALVNVSGGVGNDYAVDHGSLVIGDEKGCIDLSDIERTLFDLLSL